MKGALLAGLVWIWAVSAQTPQMPRVPTFRTGVETVVVNVSVKKGNNPVLGLQPADFILTDNGVRQRIEGLAIESVPIDVSLFMDTSGSTSGTLDHMKQDVRNIAGMLQRPDRFRLFTIGHAVHLSVPWTDGGHPLGELDLWPTHYISLVYDAVYAATAHRVAPGRRHLVVALTDGVDGCSVVRPDALRQLIGITEAVVHWIPTTGGGIRGATATCDKKRDADASSLTDLVKGSGGEIHSSVFGDMFGNTAVKAFKKVLEDYRQSYVLYFTPTGVERRGWHALKVEVSGRTYSIRARSGYFGG